MCGRRRDQGVSAVGGSEGDAGAALACRDLCLSLCDSRAGHRPELIRQLQRLHVAHTVRKLHVGDFVWVAQETRPRDPSKGVGQVGVRQSRGGGGREPIGSFLASWQRDLGNWSWTTSWSASGWTTCAAASLTAASGSKRFLYWPHHTPCSLPALGVRRNPGALLGGFKAELPQLQPRPMTAAPRQPQDQTWGLSRGTAGVQGACLGCGAC